MSAAPRPRWSLRVETFQITYECLMRDLDLKGAQKVSFEYGFLEEFQTQVIDEVFANLSLYQTKLVEAASESWGADRITPIQKAIIFNSWAEQKIHQTTKNILIDEAIKTAKRYDEENGYKFINAILNKTL